MARCFCTCLHDCPKELKVSGEIVLEGCEIDLNDQETVKSDESGKGKVAEKEKMQQKT